MDKDISKVVSKVVEALVGFGARVAVKYMSPILVVRATRILYKHNKRQIRKGEKIQIVLNIGRPNYLERNFIKDCKKAGEPFPVRNVIIKLPPESKKK